MIAVAGPSRGMLLPITRSARTSTLGHAQLRRPFRTSVSVLRAKSTTSDGREHDPQLTQAEAKEAERADAKQRTQSIAEADEALRQRMLDRDGGSASVATVNGQWEPGMGRETARQMFRVLDQARVNRPGTSVAAGEGESKHWTRRSGY